MLKRKQYPLGSKLVLTPPPDKYTTHTASVYMMVLVMEPGCLLLLLKVLINSSFDQCFVASTVDIIIPKSFNGLILLTNQ